MMDMWNMDNCWYIVKFEILVRMHYEFGTGNISEL